MRCLLASIVAVALLLPVSAVALEPEPGALFVRVVDVGAGLCCVVKIPGDDGDDFYLVYDAGKGNLAMRVINELVPDNEPIDLLVLSHTDSGDAGPITRVGFVGETRINRHDFEVSWNGEMENGGVVVSDEILITVDVEALLETELKKAQGGVV